jgi:hypothetical protein
MSKLIVKLKFGGELRRLSMGVEASNLSLKHLRSVAEQRFGKLVGSRFSIEYQDNEGDRIVVGSDDELLVALQSAQGDPKFFIEQASDGTTPICLLCFSLPNVNFCYRSVFCRGG